MRLAVGNYVRPGPLWWAFDWDDANQQAERTRTQVPLHDSLADPRNGCVVLIDEIDKAESDVPNGLLEAVGSGRFTPFGQTRAVEVRGEPPLVAITTNEERVLPNAFLRRCLVLELRLPGDDPGLIEHLIERAAVHFPARAEDSKALFRKAASYWSSIVERPGKGTRRRCRARPSTSTPRAVFHLEPDSVAAQERLLESVSRYAVCKYEQAGS